ncbi:prefoldin subunit 6 isoform X1 [Chrysemys picta bellii]|uniref:prefoldin subunit 6 isoform X1 n=1 Tax=Chrysemys picta bellii TaxID=8478 RepID=UPI000CE642ED|nr:prefoldin subunit 6 isoform X2 [Chrysemys picta bellii]
MIPRPSWKEAEVSCLSGPPSQRPYWKRAEVEGYFSLPRLPFPPTREGGIGPDPAAGGRGRTQRPDYKSHGALRRPAEVDCTGSRVERSHARSRAGLSAGAARSDLSKSMAARQKLEAQLTENNIVKEELGLLDATNTVYKLIGPVLVKQDMDEAKATVSKRLDYIAGEIKRYELQMQESEKKAEQQREVLARLQQEYQRAQGKGAAKA